ncbi:hypothetical protein EFA69_18150 [Rufibacter immobilis]|uniref:Uncharacterized protein n=1 Tax=Rufibacter immobilis TaxID=1348778 RepID=A0A3M9MR69_9BACT|nr:hypothetical protein [Rufibacter immobilis]RNI28006.1 hypothetical protein EFA69_18150 [Rufibacter immobilis]
MADEKNKNLDNNQNTVSNQAEPGRTPEAVGKLPLPDDVNDNPGHDELDPGMKPNAGGRKGNISVEDGGNVDGSSSASR